MTHAVMLAKQQGRHPARTAASGGVKYAYRTQVSGVIASALTISIAYTLYNSLGGTAYGASDARDPVLWLYYALAFSLVALVRVDARWSWGVVATALFGMIGIGLFYYPTLFTPEVQRPLGWVENDLYMGLLILAEYLCIQQLRRATLVPGDRPDRLDARAAR